MSAQKKNSQKPGLSAKWRNWHFYLLFIVLSFVFYGGTVGHKYSMDDDLVTTTYEYPSNDPKDRELISRHDLVEKGISGIPEIFTSHYARNQKQSYSYRPVTTSSFAIEYQFFGSNPAVSHFFNVLLYGLVVILLFRLIRIALPRAKIGLALIISLLFLIHPIHTEVVCSIKSRDELLCLGFGLGALIYLLKFADQKKWWILLLSFVFLLLSILSKRTGFVFIPIAALTLYFFRDVKLWKIIVSAVVLSSLVLIRRLIVVGMVGAPVLREKMFYENPLYFSDSLMDRVPMFFYTMAYYIKLLFVPYPLRYYYGYQQVEIATWEDPLVWISAVVLIAFVLFLFWRIRKKELWVYGALFFFLAIGGVCNLLFPAVGIIAERFVFVASIGFSMVAGWFLFKLITSEARIRSKLGIIGSAILVLVCFVQIVSRNPDWEDRATIYQNDMPHLQLSAKAHSLLGQYYATEVRGMQGKIRAAQQNNNMQLVQEYNSKLDSAIHHFARCIEIYPDYTVSYNNLGAMYYLFKGDNEKAQINFQKAIELDSDYIEANFNLANTYVWDHQCLSSLTILIERYRDTLVYSNAPPDQFLEENSDLATSFGRFHTGLTATLKTVANSATSSEAFITSLKQNLEYGVKNFGLQDIYSQSRFDAAIIKEADTLQALAANGSLIDYIENMVLDNMSQAIFMSRIKGKYNHQQLKDHLREKADELDQYVIRHMEKALQVNPGYSPALKKLSEYYLETERYQECVDLNQRALEEPSFRYYYTFHLNAGNAYLRMDNIMGAIASFESGVTEFQRHINDIQTDKTLDKKVRFAQLNEVKSKFKQLCGSLAGLYNVRGDTVNAQKYLELSKKI